MSSENLDTPAGEGPAEPASAPASPRTPPARWRLLAALALCLSAAVVSGLLLLEHHGVSRVAGVVEQVCGEGEQSGCAAVARSAYSEIRGVPLAALGLVFYSSVALLLLLGLLAGPAARSAAASLALLGLALALLVDVGLLGVQLIAVRAFCKLCILTYAFGALALMLLLRARRDLRVVAEALARAESRLALLGWAIASVLLAGGVLAAEKGLDYRDRLLAGNVLGPLTPPPSLARPSPASPAATAAGSPPAVTLAPGANEVQRWQEEARAATEQARRLQEILDDPQKLESYFADKAAKEYDAAPVQEFKLDGVPFKGPSQAPLKVVEFSDFLCPFCRNLAAAFGSYLPGSAGRVMVYFKNYPLDAACNPHVSQTVHQGACLVAMGGVCAQEQGRFWAYHDKAFGTELKNPDWKAVLALAADAGLDVSSFESCLKSPRAKDGVAADVAEANRGGVHATPTLFINGKRLPRLNDFTATVDKELQRLGLPPIKPSGQ